jgi:hypothetical protein
MKKSKVIVTACVIGTLGLAVLLTTQSYIFEPPQNLAMRFIERNITKADITVDSLYGPELQWKTLWAMCSVYGPCTYPVEGQVVRDGPNGTTEITIIFTPTSSKTDNFINRRMGAFFSEEKVDGHWSLRCAELLDVNELNRHDICK